MQAEEMPSQQQPQDEAAELVKQNGGSVKAEILDHPEFVLSTKNLERVREELRQEEIMKELKPPLKSEPASPTKAEVLVMSMLIVHNLVVFLTLFNNYFRSRLKQVAKVLLRLQVAITAAVAIIVILLHLLTTKIDTEMVTIITEAVVGKGTMSVSNAKLARKARWSEEVLHQAPKALVSAWLIPARAWREASSTNTDISCEWKPIPMAADLCCICGKTKLTA